MDRTENDMTVQAQALSSAQLSTVKRAKHLPCVCENVVVITSQVPSVYGVKW